MAKIEKNNSNENSTERRFLTLGPEIRVEGDDKGKRLVGYAAVFNVLSDFGYFREKIAPGAFTEAIAQDDVRSLFNHDSSLVLGRNKAKTLRMKEDDEGLLTVTDVPDTTVGRDLLISVDRGDITGMSFAFRMLKEEWDNEDEDETPIRTLTKVKLFDISVVTYPAYPDTSVGVRSLDNWLKNEGAVRSRARAMKMRLRLLDVT
jgi:HK97 family phage prohead protease